jgi:hypothetical protein
MTNSLPTSGATNWGTQLNNWLLVGHNTSGSVLLDTSSADIAWPAATAAAGTVGLPADSGHVHPQNVAWINVRNPAYGAVGNGSHDDTSAINAALTAVSNAQSLGLSAGLYLPSGNYLVSSALTYNSSSALHIRGDAVSGGGGSGSCIKWVPGSSAYNVLNIQQAHNAVIRDIVMIPSAAPTVTGHTAIYYGSGSWIGIFGVDINGYGGAVASASTTGIQIAGSTATIEDSNVQATTQALWQTTGCAGLTTNRCLWVTNAGTNSGCILMDGASGSIRITNTCTIGGDRGFYMVASGGHSPEFVFINDFEVNNCAVEGMGFVNGAQVFANQLWLTNNDGTEVTPVHGVNFYSTFTGGVYINNINVGAFGGHGVWIQGGTGYTIVGGNIGTCGTLTANTYDDIHVAAAATVTTVSDVHFDTDPYTGPGTNKARSAIYIESGAASTTVSGNTFDSTGYATAPIIDMNASPGFYQGNVGGPNTLIPNVYPTFQNFSNFTGTSGSFHPATAIAANSGIIVQVMAAGAATVAVSDGANTYAQISAEAVGSGSAVQYVFAAVKCSALTTSSTITVTSSVSQACSASALSVPRVSAATALVASGSSTAPSVSGTLASPLAMEIAYFFNGNTASLNTAPSSSAGWVFQGGNSYGVLANSVYWAMSAGSSGTATAGYASSQQWAAVLVSLRLSHVATAQIAPVNYTAGTITALGTQAAGQSGQLADAAHVHPTTGLLTTAGNLGSLANTGTSRTNLGISTGTGTLASGAATVAATQVTASSSIFLTHTGSNTNAGELSVATKTAGTGFTVTSTSGTDATTFNYLIIG